VLKFNKFPSKNNLDWIRLALALQVVLTHASVYLHSPLRLPNFISNFPGVPGFFFLSGFLIYSSYLNSRGYLYFQNRFLRLFPGLISVTIGGAAVILFALGWDALKNNTSTFLIWFLSQITLGQAYNPELFRSVGIGTINGSLWTITTEIIFYLIVPLIVFLEQRFRFTVIILMGISFFIYANGPLLLSNDVYRQKSIFDLLALTPLVWGWMFGFGILTAKYYKDIECFIKFLPILFVPLVIMILFGEGLLFKPDGNRLGLFYFICYVGLILWFAFGISFVKLPFDLSYGAYIWHAPIINLLLIMKLPSLPIAILMTLIIAAFSWYFIEKPVLKLKLKSMRPINQEYN
jgi:peptidoglycan/LPS O-acetylase OafA/YrhL